MKKGSQLAAIGVGVAALASCGGEGATPENCPGDVPTFEYVRSARYGAEDTGDSAPAVPARILPAQFGTLLIPTREGDVHRAIASDPKFATFDILNADGSPKACDTQNPCDGEEECDTGRCVLETRYYDALQPAQEARLVEFGYKPSPNTRSARDTSACGTTSPPDDDPCIVNTLVERCGDDGVNASTCTDVVYPTCFTPRGAPGAGL